MTVLNKDQILDAAKDLVTQGKLDKAIREYEKLLAVDPKDMRVKMQIAELFIKRRQVADAVKVYREVAESYSHDGFFLKAVTILKNILRLNPSLLEVNQSLAVLYEKMGLAKDAIHQYEILTASREQKGEFPEALKLKEKLVELAPQQPSYRVRLAEAYQRDGNQEASIQQYEKLAEHYRQTEKDGKKLMELYERILPQRPDNKQMLTDLVDLYYAKKDYKSALKWLEKRKQIVSVDPHLLGLQAQIYATLNQFDSARGKYQELAELYQTAGDHAKALEAYQEILVFLPEEAETVRALIEEIEQGAFEGILAAASQKRQQRVEEQRLKEEALEREKEAKERERLAEKEAQSKGAVAKGGTEAKPVSPPPTRPQTKMPAEKQALNLDDTERLLKIARTSIALVKAYMDTGLKEEAVFEAKHAKEAIAKILSFDPTRKEASLLNQEIEGLLG